MSTESYPHRRPFLARGSKVVRCEACQMPAQVCICDYRVNAQAQARFWLLTHPKEFYKPTNTGRLIVDTIRNSETFAWNRTEPDEAFVRQLNDPGFDPYIVFPEGEAYQERMVDFEHKPGREPVFIILDGTWRQARRIFRQSEYLQHVPVIQPNTQRKTRYNLRKPNEDHHLCTAEVAAVMLEQMGDSQSAALLDAYFDVFNAHYYAARRSRMIEGVDEAKALLAQAISRPDLVTADHDTDSV